MLKENNNSQKMDAMSAIRILLEENTNLSSKVGVEVLKKRFNIAISRGTFDVYKSRIRKQKDIEESNGRNPLPPPIPPLSPPTPCKLEDLFKVRYSLYSTDSADLIDVLTSLREAVKQLGPVQVRRLIDWIEESIPEVGMPRIKES